MTTMFLFAASLWMSRMLNALQILFSNTKLCHKLRSQTCGR